MIVQSTWRGLRMFLHSIWIIILAGAVNSLFAADTPPGKLLDSPFPFYHDYNLSALFPLGKRSSKKAKPVPSSSLTLDECIDLALKRNPDHNISREALRDTWGDILVAWGQYVPNMFVTYGFSESETAFPITSPQGVSSYRSRTSKSSYATLGLSLTVFSQARQYFGLRNAYYLRSARRSELRGSELNLVNAVRSAYFNVLRQEKLLQAARDQADQLKEQLRRAETRHSLGEVTKLDVLQAQIDLQDQELLILEYENLVIATKMDLDQVVGGGLGSGFTLAGEFEIREPHFDVDGLVKESLERHPDLESLQMQIKQGEGNLWMGRLAYLPVLKAAWGLSRNETGIIIMPDYQRGRQVTFTASWNILDGFLRFQENRSAEVTVNSLKFQLAKTTLSVERNVRVSYLELLRQYKRNLGLADSRDKAEQSLKLERRLYQLGSSSMVELRKAQADFTQAEVDYINSIYDYHVALSELGRNVGRDMSREGR